MISSSRAITLVLISTATILAGYHTFDRAYNDDGLDEWTNGPTTRSSSSHSHYYGHHYGGGSGFFGSSGSSSAHGTSHGGFGGTGHAAGS